MAAVSGAQRARRAIPTPADDPARAPVHPAARDATAPARKRVVARKPKQGGHLVGYARVSTAEQDPALQLDVLGLAGCWRVFTDHASGSREDRPELAAALNCLRPGDTLVVWRLDRLGRSLQHLIDTVTGLAAATARGRVGGRPRTMTAAKLRLARAMRAQTPPMSLSAIATELGLTKSTVARNLRATDEQVSR